MASGVQVEVMLTLVNFFKLTCGSIRKAINLNIPTNPLQQIMCTVRKSSGKVGEEEVFTWQIFNYAMNTVVLLFVAGMQSIWLQLDRLCIFNSHVALYAMSSRDLSINCQI